jgi:hypothetical protein
MDREVLKRQLHERFEQALAQMIDAVDQAPDGRWIAASEWEVRRAGQDLTRDCYQAILQDRVDRTPAAATPPPSPPSAGRGPATQQGQPKRRRAQRGR